MIVDDEPDILDFMTYNLEKNGYKVHCAGDGNEAIAKAIQYPPDLILLDLMMPEMDGLEVCKELRRLPDFDDKLIVFLTAKNEDMSEIEAFKTGADDYITKPIKPKVLLARIESLLKRRNANSDEILVYEYQDMIISKENYQVNLKDKLIDFPKKEFDLLFLLASKPGKVFTREEILTKVWGDEVIVGDRTIDVHIRKLREKLGDEYFVTIKGVGYKMQL